MKSLLVSAIFLIFAFFISAKLVSAQETIDPQLSSLIEHPETLEAIIEKVTVVTETSDSTQEETQFNQDLELLITQGSLKGKRITVNHNNLNNIQSQKYQLDDKVLVSYTQDSFENDFFFITDYVRRDSLLLLFIIFIICTLFIARWKGLASLLAMVISFLVIFFFVIKQISLGADAVLIAVSGAFIIIPSTFLLSHGFNKKTLVAIFSTLIALIMTITLANGFMKATRLTGLASEEAGFLQAIKPEIINVRGLLLAGIIIGALGVLDDITIAQAAIVFELKKTDRQLKFKQLYQKAMDIGRDHIGSMVNTLILVYAGASLPLLLLFMDNPMPFGQLINSEIMAEEIVRTLVSSIGLILAVPITTVTASLVAVKQKTP